MHKYTERSEPDSERLAQLEQSEQSEDLDHPSHKNKVQKEKKAKKIQLSLKGRALKYLSVREYSRHELAQKLASHAENAEQLEQCLNELEQAQYLSNQRFSQSFIHRRQHQFGNQKILLELHQHQLAEEILSDVKEELKETEHERALQVLCKKYPIEKIAQTKITLLTQLEVEQTISLQSDTDSQVVNELGIDDVSEVASTEASQAFQEKAKRSRFLYSRGFSSSAIQYAIKKHQQMCDDYFDELMS